MFRQRRGRLVLAAFATLIVLAIGAALFVLPIKSWMRQRDSLATRTGELATLNGANNQLQTEVDRLQTDDGVKQAAREVIDYVEKGEQRITVMPVGPAPTALPAGWPYDLVTSIVALRQAQAAGAPTSAAATTTPTTPATLPAPTTPSTSAPAAPTP
jgi:cell division protein FtsB